LRDDASQGLGGLIVRVFVAILAALSLVGCASKAADITPTYVSPIQYQSFTRPQLAAEAQRVSAAAAAASGAQDSQATKDAVATTAAVIIFWPAAFLVQGDKNNAAQLAQLKGQMDAIQQASIMKNCGIQFQQAPPPKS
jgi:cobalamin synthase